MASAATTSRSAPRPAHPSKPGRNWRETCGHTVGRRPPPAAPNRSRDRPGPPRTPSGRWGEGRRQAEPHPRPAAVLPFLLRGHPDPPRPSPSAPQPDAAASRLDPGRLRRGAHHPVTGALRSVTTNAAALFLRLLGDPPTSPATNETRSLRESVLRGPVRVLPRQKAKKKKKPAV